MFVIIKLLHLVLCLQKKEEEILLGISMDCVKITATLDAGVCFFRERSSQSMKLLTQSTDQLPYLNINIESSFARL